jgi:Protein of unknown function (DUF2961)
MSLSRLAVACILSGVAALSCSRSCSSPEPEPARLVAELADAESLGLYADWNDLPVLGGGHREKQSSADRERGAVPEIPLWDHGNRDMNNFVCRSEDADAPPSGVPFVYDMERCPEPYVHGVVLARFEGPGRLARLWLTAASFRGAPPDREQLRIWIDDTPTPSVDVLLREVMDGTAGEMFAPPFGSGNTRRMAWYYPLVFAKKLIVALDRLGEDDLYFHQTDVVLDDGPRERRASPTRLPVRDTAVGTLRGRAPDTGSAQRKRLQLAGGERASAFALSGPATIEKTVLRVARAQLATLSDLVLEVRWDGDAAPAIALPIAELFGAFDAPPDPAGRVLGSRSDGDRIELWLRLPMPFSSASVWTLENRGNAAASVEIELAVRPGVPKRGFGHLSAERHDTTEPQAAAHPIASMNGRGRLVGACVALSGHGLLEQGGRHGNPMQFLEGDEKLRLDGRALLSGTGTEDYFDSSFFFDDGPRATPFAQVWGIGATPPGGKVSACRWHVLGDTIDFAKSLDLALEIGPGVPELLDRYRSVAFLYR